jgi:hypothetical protein
MVLMTWAEPYSAEAVGLLLAPGRFARGSRRIEAIQPIDGFQPASEPEPLPNHAVKNPQAAYRPAFPVLSHRNGAADWRKARTTV